MSVEVAKGRVQTLTQDEELHLKQVWAYLFQHWGVQVNSASVFASETAGSGQSGSSGGNKNAEEKPAKKSGKLFGRFRKSSSNSSAAKSSRESNGAVPASSQRSTEPSEGARSHGTVHEALKNLKPDEISENFWDMLRSDYPDNLILRFLRARKWDTDKALGMIAHTLEWRLKEGHPDSIIRGGEQAAYQNNETGYIKNLELSKATQRGFDLHGRPIVLVRPRLHHSSDQTEEEMKKYCLLIIEQARMFLKEPVDSATILFDLTGFSMSNMDYTPVQYLISCFEAHYPECLGHLFIHKAPWIFPPIWNIIKNWLDPVVASKIVFTKNASDLAKYVPMKYIPSYLGGEDEYDFDSFKRPDESADVKLKDTKTRDSILEKRKSIIQQFIDSTKNWIESQNDEESKKWLETKISISKELSENYRELDPYIRSRSVYDINGTLKV
ncbi:Csr1p [Lachancea thermotolerans CBS 6340]|uniref:KLTH0D14014p n=1 Tax=Lachancea thermotolerans (strain ATCC 56472 / CBS 6340 / NRRL Y-8284) TaxID=559295 RepID=C5DFC5_LACTC|nr:KLTH0D14014p [Lachancea thermotolerans CBS 6340]CAR22880.1 KLTH0D14014p [Lachancea thermotolerans CBS 6340]